MLPPQPAPGDVVTLLMRHLAADHAAMLRVPGGAPVHWRGEGFDRCLPGEQVELEISATSAREGVTNVEGRLLSLGTCADALPFSPLAIHVRGAWTPSGVQDDRWRDETVARGRRRVVEMEQILPGFSPDDDADDPIIQAADLLQAGDRDGAVRALLDLAAKELRCLDAHAHLGHFALGIDPGRALRHYEVGIALGAASLGDAFDGILPWDWIDNRPFLRCLHGAAMACWALGRTDQALAAVDLWVLHDPTDRMVQAAAHEQIASGAAFPRQAAVG